MYIATRQWQSATTLIDLIYANIDKLSLSRPTVFARINLAKNAIDLQANNPVVGDRPLRAGFANRNPQIENLLQETLKQSRMLEDKRAEASTLGTLGYFYERQQQWSIARKFTEQALELSQAINATDISYQWQWQLGRLQKKQGDVAGAIAPYTEAVNNLQSLRSSLVAINPDAQFSFRESVEPVYRELVATLLDGTPSQAQLKQARETIESLQLAELENFFQEVCLTAKPKQIDDIDPTAAVIYPIILRDRLAVILSLPDRSLRYYSTYLPQAKIESTIENLYQSFNPVFSNQIRLQLSQQVYDWSIEPAEAELTKHEIKTLAFVLDGSLRNIPMAALYDGKQYAIEKYNIALTPGLQLLPPTSLKDNLKAVAGGISQSNQGFASPPGVQTELTEISSYLPTKLLLDSEFTEANLQTKLARINAPILHIATHGQFSSDPENTYILTWNDRVKVNEFETLLRNRQFTQINPLDLMVLSACQTAAGDKQAALGLAGVAVRSGARSTLATLWSVKDNSTTLLMNEFYQELVRSQSGLNKGEALRQAQLALIDSEDFDHPFYWAAFVLVGNWL
ncbi:CHAT domain-containing protein [Myxosarcina sp. GI1]|uniref:CHAT domain-containing protein n=1 Tax=Myxosarcina sp. GI1 TaxID=1541065 RepID=UPI00068928C0|nr:CHAT domain-containing protein [Myxosarcina sp. GI1]